MIEIPERFDLIYKKLKALRIVKTQEEFAESIGSNRSSISCIINRKGTYTGENILPKILEVYSDIINKDFILHGTGPIDAVPVSGGLKEGEMLDETTPASEPKNYSVNMDSLMEAFKQQQNLTAQAQKQVNKSQEQIDRLLDIISNMQK